MNFKGVFLIKKDYSVKDMDCVGHVTMHQDYYPLK